MKVHEEQVRIGLEALDLLIRSKTEAEPSYTMTEQAESPWLLVQVSFEPYDDPGPRLHKDYAIWVRTGDVYEQYYGAVEYEPIVTPPGDARAVSPGVDRLDVSGGT